MLKKLFSTHKIAGGIVAIALFVALFAPFLANNKPLWVLRNAIHYFPVFSDDDRLVITAIQQSDWYLLPLIPYHPRQSDLKNANYQSPFAIQNHSSMYWRHWLGTGKRGEDVLAILIYGTRSALLLGLGAVCISAVIGLLLGFFSAWFHQNPIAVTYRSFWIGLIVLPLSIFFVVQLTEYVHVRSGFPYWVGLPLISLTLIGIYRWLFVRLLRVRSKVVKSTMVLPLATVINMAIDLFIAVPKLPFLILWSVCFAVSPFSQILCLGLLLWPSIAKLTRSEVLKQFQEEYILAAKSLGFSSFRVAFNHILPIIFPTIAVAMLFCGISAILYEVSLAYLGIGISEQITWGSLIHQIRTNIHAWWLVLFPVLTISIGSYALYTLMGVMRKDTPDAIY